MQRAWLIVIGLALGVVCYYLPWVTHSTAVFTMNAFDLAEWTSLHPAVRSSSPPMLTSFLLRLPQVMLAAAFALSANLLVDLRARWIQRGLALLLALRLVPPTDFFTGASADPNYRQMALLTGLGIALVVLAAWAARLPRQWQIGLLISVLVIAVLGGWWGLSRAGVLLDNFEIDVQIGAGIICLTAITLVIVVLGLRRRAIPNSL